MASVDDFSSRISECRRCFKLGEVQQVVTELRQNKSPVWCASGDQFHTRVGVGPSALALVMHLPSSIPSSEVQIDLDTVHLPVTTQPFDSEIFGCETKGHHQLKEESLEHWT